MVDLPGLVIGLILQLIFPSVGGSFMPTHVGAETDLRFVFCAGKEKKCHGCAITLFKIFRCSSMNQFSYSLYQLPYVLCWRTGVAWTRRKQRNIY